MEILKTAGKQSHILLYCKHAETGRLKNVALGAPLYLWGFTLRKHPFVPEIPTMKSRKMNKQMYHNPEAFTDSIDKYSIPITVVIYFLNMANSNSIW